MRNGEKPGNPGREPRPEDLKNLSPQELAEIIVRETGFYGDRNLVNTPPDRSYLQPPEWVFYRRNRRGR